MAGVESPNVLPVNGDGGRRDVVGICNLDYLEMAHLVRKEHR
jgi:hypothetical protein